ncbi:MULTISPECIES: copper resistance CopC family protein [unclassified Corynebacterium]|uniref:copper resistance CopC family protein n=1 Tax=unclassified Corynebacterium TaxID=2624378 RepID=UPI00352625FF
MRQQSEHQCRRGMGRAISALCASVIILGAQSGLGPAWSETRAVAHDVVINSTPADGATVEVFPREIILEFSGIPRDSFNTVAVSDTETSTVLFSDEPALEDQIVRVAVPDDITPGPGEYTVGFQITSSDGHATRGRTTFTVSDEGVPSEDLLASESNLGDSARPGSAESSTPYLPGIAIGAGLLLLVIVGAGLILKKRK